MFKHYAFLFWLSLSCLALLAQNATYNLVYVGELSFPASNGGCGASPVTGGSDVWGYTTPDGVDYALMGVMEGIAVVRMPDLAVIDVVTGPQSGNCYWHRDIKTYGHYAYATSELNGTNEGIMIMDLQYLPDSVRFVKAYTSDPQIRSHNLSIDVNTGYAYVCNQNDTGFRIVDLSDPENPVDVNNVSTIRIHDVYARNDTVYVSESSQSNFSIWDVSDKNNPQMMARFSPPAAGLAHNAWPTDDGKYLLTTEETSGKTVKIWDIQDMSNINVVGEYLAPNNLAHNVHVMGDLAVISHYTYGISVVDISDVANPVEVGHYDTYPANNASGFNGSWGAFPFTQNGYIYGSDMNGVLTVLKLEESPADIEPQETLLPNAYTLAQNFPNPFNPNTSIRFSLPEASATVLTIYNSLGQKVRTLVNENLPAGSHTFQWDGRNQASRDMPSGVYFYKLFASGKQNVEITKQMLLVR